METRLAQFNLYRSDRRVKLPEKEPTSSPGHACGLWFRYQLPVSTRNTKERGARVYLD